MEESDKLIIGNKEFNSRLMLGTGKYRSVRDVVTSIESSEAEIITVAIRRLPANLKNDHTTFLGSLDWGKLWLLPNTAGSQTAEEAIRMAFLGHELACQLGQPDNFL
jgi:thiazole synthase